MNNFLKWIRRWVARNRHETRDSVPDEIRDAIDRVALFIARCEQAMLGDYFAATQVGRDASLLVVWAFKTQKRESRFVAFLENRDVDDGPDRCVF